MTLEVHKQILKVILVLKINYFDQRSAYEPPSLIEGNNE